MTTVNASGATNRELMVSVACILLLVLVACIALFLLLYYGLVPGTDIPVETVRPRPDVIHPPVPVNP